MSAIGNLCGTLLGILFVLAVVLIVGGGVLKIISTMNSRDSLQVKQLPPEGPTLEQIKEVNKAINEARVMAQADNIVHRKGLKMIQEQRQVNHEQKRKRKK